MTRRSSRVFNFLARSIIFALEVLIPLTTAAPLSHRFTSHVSVNTPARSFTHGVGDVAPSGGSTYNSPYLKVETHGNFRNLRVLPYSSHPTSGYPKIKPPVPFFREETNFGNTLGQASPWHYFDKIPTIPALPPSPYRANSPNPESLWPEGLFIPPSIPLKGYKSFNDGPQFAARNDNFDEVLTGNFINDPYLLEGTEALRAIEKAKRHGELYFHDIPHVKSLLENQQLRTENDLQPHKLGSIRTNWAFYRL